MKTKLVIAYLSLWIGANAAFAEGAAGIVDFIYDDKTMISIDDSLYALKNSTNIYDESDRRILLSEIREGQLVYVDYEPNNVTLQKTARVLKKINDYEDVEHLIVTGP